MMRPPKEILHCFQRMLDGVQALGPVARIPGRVLTAELWGAEAPLWANPLLQLELPAVQRTVDWREPPVAVVLAALPTAWVEAAAGGAALTVLRPLRQFSPLPQEGERAAAVEILRLVGWQLPGIITPAGWRRGRPGLRSTAARPAPQPAAAGGGAAGEPQWVGFAHGPGVVGKLTCKLAVALQLRAVVDERRVRRAATVEAALALDHGPHGGPRASDAQVCTGLRGLEAAVPALWRVPLLNARKEPLWRLWVWLVQPPPGVQPGVWAVVAALVVDAMERGRCHLWCITSPRDGVVPPARSVAVERAGALATIDLWDVLASFAAGGVVPRG
ncbi:hypothetical protein FOA52_004621 [Chlamydomonas sp. UWO 241]|nr:hypothetical protein FOA52_004621 [Chlamydomonas sp. UWO 241]